jgi:hypothetical protein
MFPGDNEFSMGRYGDLSYGYVLNAVTHGMTMDQTDMYHRELPIAQLTSVTANQNRDPKKTPQPYTADTFSFFKPKHLENLPAGYYGSAAVTMVKNGTYPAWALFCFKELNSMADPGYVPGLPALVSEDAILLHPIKTENGYKGMLVAREAAGGKMVEFKGSNDVVISLYVPEVKTKVVAEEDVTLLASYP